MRTAEQYVGHRCSVVPAFLVYDLFEWQDLHEGLDTARLLAAVDIVDVLRTEWSNGEDGRPSVIRDHLLWLHRLAMAVSTNATPDLLAEFFEWAGLVEDIAKVSHSVIMTMGKGGGYEIPFICRMADGLSKRCALIPWLAEASVEQSGLTKVIC
ncbi:MAG: hypothetical protein EKK46_17775 [Rhodocyclaceae bacterium]|nr:MAG: hypothetical protein EKK46_17775 [Rhodocyclaceae bacterium]